MTENQEKELFTTLAALVTGVNAIQVDVKELKSDVGTLKSDVGTLKSDVGTLKSDVGTLKSDVREIRVILREHSQSLVRIEAKTDSIADTVLNHEKRLTKLEKESEDSRDRIH